MLGKLLGGVFKKKSSAAIAMNIIATVADEGGIGEEERAALTQCASWMNLSIKDYL